MLNISFLAINAMRKPLLSSVSRDSVLTVQLAGMKNWNKYKPPKPIDSSEWPENRRLRQIDKTPNFDHLKGKPHMPKTLKLIRGPELVHTELLYKGYGVKALLGGRLKFQHFEAIKRCLFKRIIVSRMFAVWRVEPPWQPCSKKSVGKRMGGGKGATHHYVTPVKAERIIVELGGDIHPIEAKKILGSVVEVLPFAARVVSHQSLRKEKNHELWVEENNINPYTMEYVIRNNMGGCHNWLAPNDHKWFGKYK